MSVQVLNSFLKESMIKLLHQITVFHSVSSGERGELKVDMIVFFFPLSNVSFKHLRSPKVKVD